MSGTAGSSGGRAGSGGGGAGGGAGKGGAAGAAGANGGHGGAAAGGAAGSGGAAGTNGVAGGGGAGGGAAGGGAGGTAGAGGAAGSHGAGGAGGAAGQGGAGGEHGSTDAATPICTVKINELQTGGSTALDEFVELYNTCPDQALDLTGYALVYRSAGGTTDSIRVSFTGGGFAAGKPYYVCANTGYAGPADAHYTDGLAEAGGGLAIRDAAGNILDSVGWGTATNTFVEGSPAPAPSAGQSIARMPDGHDTNDNSTDFTIISSPTTPGAANPL